nr:unnamed protein product [Callosobruchus analis]
MRPAIPARINLQITLSYLASGNSYRTLQRLFRVSRAAISKFVPEVCDAICGSLKEYLDVSIKRANVHFHCYEILTISHLMDHRSHISSE